MNGSLLAAARRAVRHWLASGNSSSGVAPGGGPAGVDSPLTLTPVRPGMSGAAVFDCCVADGRRYALKAWPAGTEPARIAEVHRVVRWVRENGCEFIPSLVANAAGSTFAAEAGRWWEMAPWMPGEPLPASASPVEIETGAAAIGRFHAVAAELAVTVQRPPAVAARLRRLRELAPLVPKAVAMAPADRIEPELTEPLAQASRLLAAHWPVAAERIAARLTPWAERAEETTYVLRDVHREHLLFDISLQEGRHHGSVAGLIDFDAVRIDSPACDLARWVSGFLTGRSPEEAEDVWQAAVAGFEQIRPFAIQHQRMARELLVATTWISLANWMVWLCVEQRRFPAGAGAVAERIGHLCELASRLLHHP